MSKTENIINTWFVNKFSHLIIICEIHQNVPTLSSYNPLWTGKIAVNTSVVDSMLEIHGIQIIAVVKRTVNPITNTYLIKMKDFEKSI